MASTTIAVSPPSNKAVTSTTTSTTNNATASVSVTTPSNLSNFLSGLVTIDVLAPIREWWNKDTTQKALYNVAFFVVGIVLLLVGLKMLSYEVINSKPVKQASKELG